MPFYDYGCHTCGDRITRLRDIADRQKSISCSSCKADMILMPAMASISKSASANQVSAPVVNTNSAVTGTTLHNVHISNCNVGVSMPEGAAVNMQNVTFDNVKTPVKIRPK